MSSILAYTDDHAAYIGTDAGTFDLATGAIVALGSKVVVFKAVGMLITASGPYGHAGLMDAMAKEILIGTQAAFAAALPRVCRRLRDRARIERPDQEAAGLNSVRVVAALYDAERGPRVIEVSTAGDYQPREGDGFMQPELPRQIAARIMPGGVPRDRREAQRYFIEARRMAHPDVANGCVVAGDCDLYRVGPESVTFETIVSFPDKVGERPDRRRAGKLH